MGSDWTDIRRFFVAILALFGMFACDQDPSFSEKVVSPRKTEFQESPPESKDTSIKEDSEEEETTGRSDETSEEEGNTGRLDESDAQPSRDGSFQPVPEESREGMTPDSDISEGGVDRNGDGQAPFQEYSRTFSSHEIQEQRIELSYENNMEARSLTLKRKTSIFTKDLSQLTRPYGSDQFVQGHSGEEVVDQFIQSANRPLDLLIVMDNSRSMEDEQQNLARKLTPLLEYIKHYDWQIAVTTTDSRESCLRSVIKKGDPNPWQAFYQAVLVGTYGDGNERGVYNAVRGLRGSCLRKRWLREESTVSVLIVSDEDNCSDGMGCAGADAKSDYLLNYLRTIREPGYTAKVYGLFWHPNDPHWRCPTAYMPGVVYEQLVSSTGGEWGSICSSDYSSTLKKISADMQDVLIRSFSLSYVPDQRGVRVFIDGLERRTGFTQVGQALTFLDAPPQGAQIRVVYSHSSKPIEKVFHLGHVPDPNTLDIWVDGEKIPSEAYELSGRRLTFSEAPKARSKVHVRYFYGSRLPRIFKFGENIVDRQAEVFVDGEKWPFKVINAKKGLISLDTPPPDGRMVQLRYLVKGDPILAYPFEEDVDWQDVVVRDQASGEVLEVALHQGFIVIPPATFQEDRILSISFMRPRQIDLVVLENEPLNGDLRITNQLGQECPKDRWQIQGKQLDVTNCFVDGSEGQIDISYRFYSQSQTHFDVEPDFSLAGFEVFWKVYVDEQETNAFKVNGKTVFLEQEIEAPAKVKVSLFYRRPSPS